MDERGISKGWCLYGNSHGWRCYNLANGAVDNLGKCVRKTENTTLPPFVLSPYFCLSLTSFPSKSSLGNAKAMLDNASDQNGSRQPMNYDYSHLTFFEAKVCMQTVETTIERVRPMEIYSSFQNTFQIDVCTNWGLLLHKHYLLF